MEHKTIAEVAILGHKATIWLGRGRVADGIWTKKDVIVVHIDFGKHHVEGTISFGITIPAKSYSKEEFLKVVSEEGTKRLAEIIAKDRVEDEKHKDVKVRQTALDSLTKEIERLF